MTVAQGGSLLVAGYETWPTSPLGTYTIAGDNFDLGDPTALTRAIEQVSLDGERISGRRTSNRLLKLTVVVRAATRQALDLASGALEMAINGDTWQVQWTPPQLSTEPALPVIYEAYRAITVIDYDVERLDPAYVAGAKFVRAVQIEAPAFPFGKSPRTTTISGITNVVLLDDLDSGPATGEGGWYNTLFGGIGGAWTADTSDKTQGTQSWKAVQSGPGPGYGVQVLMLGRGMSPATTMDISIMGSIGLDVKVEYAYPGPRNWTLQLQDFSGARASYTVPYTSQGTWGTIVWPVAAFTGINLTQLYAWYLSTDQLLLNEPVGGPAPPPPIVHIDNLRAFPGSSSALAVVNGGVYRFAGVPGTARANVALTAQAATGQTFGSLVAHRAPPEARPDYTPVVPLPPTTAPPFTVSLPPYQGSTGGQRWDGTHAVWLGGVTPNGTGTRTVTVTFTQTGPYTTTVSRAFVPADVVAGMLFVGIVQLPVRGLPAGDTDTPASAPATLTWSVTVSDTHTADRFSDLLVMDVRGPTVVLTSTLASAVAVIDEPRPTTSVGMVYGGAALTGLVATPDQALISGGPFTLEPGDNLVVLYSAQGAPAVSAAFSPRWLSTRSV